MTWAQEKKELGFQILLFLYQHGMIKTFYRDKPSGWTLISGLYSPLYIQLRPILSYPQGFRLICKAMGRLLQEEAPSVNKAVGIAMAGIPIVAGMSILAHIPAAFTRKLEGIKSLDTLQKSIFSYGEHSLLEGEIGPGDRLALIDDLVTRFDSKLIALEQLRHEISKRNVPDVICSTIAVVIDREQGGEKAAETIGVKLLRLIPFKTAGIAMLRNYMHPLEWDVIQRYLEDPAGFQDPQVQQQIEQMCPRSQIQA